MQSPKAILFDFDGTLAKTMEFHFLAWQKAFAEVSASILDTDYYPLEGMAMPRIAEKLLAIAGKQNIDPHAIVARKKEFYLQNNNVQIYPGVVDLINKLAQNQIKLAIVTSGMIDVLKATVDNNFLNKFSVIISNENSGRGKPFADPFQNGLDQLGLSANDCLAVENAPLGVESAKAAGLFTIGICHTVGPEILKQADLIVQNFAELAKIKQFSSLK